MASIYQAKIHPLIPSVAYFAASPWIWDQNWPWDLIIYRENFELVHFPSVLIEGAGAGSGPSAAAWVS
jgi:hypothetical protein